MSPCTKDSVFNGYQNNLFANIFHYLHLVPHGFCVYLIYCIRITPHTINTHSQQQHIILWLSEIDMLNWPHKFNAKKECPRKPSRWNENIKFIYIKIGFTVDILCVCVFFFWRETTKMEWKHTSCHVKKREMIRWFHWLFNLIPFQKTRIDLR